MTVRLRRLDFWGTLVAIVLLGLAFAFRTRAVIVDMVTVDRGELVITVNDEGETRVHDVYVLSAPVAGHMRRIDLHAGDPVTALETIVAEIQPIDPAFLDPRSEAQARADVRAAKSAKELAEEGIDFICYLESTGILTPTTREMLLNGLLNLNADNIDVDDLQWLALIILFTQPEQEQAFASMESLMFDPPVDHEH